MSQVAADPTSEQPSAAAPAVLACLRHIIYDHLDEDDGLRDEGALENAVRGVDGVELASSEQTEERGVNAERGDTSVPSDLFRSGESSADMPASSCVAPPHRHAIVRPPGRFA
jgi:hypothetical protein